MMMLNSVKEIFRTYGAESVRFAVGRIGGKRYLRQRCAPGDDGRPDMGKQAP